MTIKLIVTCEDQGRLGSLRRTCDGNNLRPHVQVQIKAMAVQKDSDITGVGITFRK